MSAADAAEQPLSETARVGDFSIFQIATTDPDRMMADWEKPGPYAELNTATSARRNQPIVTFIVFFGCQADKAGNCNVTAKFETYGPSGAPYGAPMDAPIWVGHPPPPRDNVQLSEGALGLRIEDKDPLGTYVVNVTVTDQVSGTVLRTTQSLTATE